MSRETAQWLNNRTLIGFTDRRGSAWHYRASEQGDEPNHYPGAIPIADVRRRLFNWPIVEGTVQSTYMTINERGEPVEVTVTDPTRKAANRPVGALGADDPGGILGVFRPGYQVHSYDEWLIRNVMDIVDGDDLAIGSAGLLRHGGLAWVEISIADTLEVNGVSFRPNLLAATSANGTLSSTYQTGAQVTICDNSLAAGLRRKDALRIKVRHSSRSLQRIGEVRKALEIVHRTADDFAAQVRDLCDTKVTDAQWRTFLDAHVPVPDDEGRGRTMAQTKRAQLTNLWTHDERVAPWTNTAFGVVQAVNTFTHHVQSVRGTTRPERNMLRAVTGEIDVVDAKTLTALDKVLV